MDGYKVVLVFDVGDPETVANFTYPAVNASNPAEAVINAVARTCTTGGFGPDDLIEATVTRAVPGVKANLLARHI